MSTPYLLITEIYPKENQTLAFSSKKVFPFNETSLHEILVL